MYLGLTAAALIVQATLVFSRISSSYTLNDAKDASPQCSQRCWNIMNEGIQGPAVCGSLSNADCFCEPNFNEAIQVETLKAGLDLCVKTGCDVPSRRVIDEIYASLCAVGQNGPPVAVYKGPTTTTTVFASVPSGLYNNLTRSK